MRLGLPRLRPPSRFRIVHIRAGRRARTAQAMAAAGFPAWRIRVCLGLTRTAVAEAMADAMAEVRG